MCAVAALAAAVVAGACGGGGDDRMQEVQRVRSGDLDLVLLSEDGVLNKGHESFTIEFRKADGGSMVDVGTVTTSANMPMPGMTMSGNVLVERSDVAGRYRASGDFGMAGTWQMRLEWNGPSGQGSVGFDGTVQ
jgi:hypothetical protein